MSEGAEAGDGSVRIGIVAPYPSVRAGLRALLTTDERIEVIADAGDTADLSETTRSRVDVVIVDLEPSASGDSVSEFRNLPPEVGLVLLGPIGGDARLPDLFGDRAWAYLLRESSGAELSRAVAAVAQGLVVIQPPLGHRLFTALPAQALAGLSDESEPLTNREQEVLQQVAQGLPNKTIALRLGISEHTVKFHITSILSKLGAASRTEAVRLGARRGLIVL